jgi:ATP-dependent exoDNAse (exonuclease V) beta subunit
MGATVTVSDAGARQAALDPARSFIVQAPAGSGKTELLIQRYLRLLATVGEPEEILAITFTRKAAGELQGRVLAALAAAADTAPAGGHARATWELARAAVARDQARGWRLQDHPARLRILTIDGWNAVLTRQLPLLSRFGVQPAIASEPAELYEEAARRTLDWLEEDAAFSPAIAELLAHLDNDVNSVEALLAGLLPHRDQWLPKLPHVNATQSRATLEQALGREIEHQLARLKAAVPERFAAELVALAARAGARLARQDKPSPITACTEITELPGSAPADVAAWCGLAEMLLTGKGEWRRTLDARQGFPRDMPEDKTHALGLLEALRDDDGLRAQLARARRLPPPRYADAQWTLLDALIQLLPVLAAELQAVFAVRGEVDYAEVALRALQALGGDEAPSDLALALDYRLRHILVDEFQDTSSSQYALLERLIAGWTPGDGRSLFLVGDPMQSIYRFREAEVGLFLRAQREGIGQLPLQSLALSVNFRSQAAMVAWVNGAFARIMPSTEDIADGAVRFAPATPHRTASPEPAVRTHPSFGASPAAEAEEVAELIAETRAQTPGATIAVLVRARPHLADIVPRLRLRGLSFRAVDIESLAARPPVQDLLALTRALLHPADRTAWLAVLRAPWCGLTLADLHALVSAAEERTMLALVESEEQCARLSIDGQRRLSRIATILGNAVAERRRAPLRRWVEGVWLALGGPAVARNALDLEDAAAYLELLEGLDDAGDCPAFDTLEERLQRLYSRPDPTAGEMLQVMTVHKAKGLEFDVVIVPGLGRTPRRGARSLLSWVERPRSGRVPDLLMAPIKPVGADSDPLGAFLGELDAEQECYEQARLLYVAATRARDRVHLFGHVDVKSAKDGTPIMGKPRKDALLAHLWPAVKSDFTEAFNAGGARQLSVSAAENASAVQPIRRLRLDWARPEPPPAVSVSLDLPAALPKEELIEFSWAGETARHVGVVIHRALAEITATSLVSWTPNRIDSLREVFGDMLMARGVAADARADAAERVVQALTTMLEDATGRWILDQEQSEARSEYALSAWRDGRAITGVVDRTFVDAEGVRWIIDYKTSSHLGGDLEAFLEREVERYREKLESYAGLFKLREQRPIRLGLYFPLLGEFKSWAV